jgi:hypothetical protein
MTVAKRKKPVPKKNPTKSKKKSVSTSRKVKATPYIALDISQTDQQQNEIINAYTALAGIELYQYANSNTVDGAYSDVAIIGVLSDRRQQHLPNDDIELAVNYVEAVWVEDGNLCISINDTNLEWARCVLSFMVDADVKTISTVD